VIHERQAPFFTATGPLLGWRCTVSLWRVLLAGAVVSWSPSQHEPCKLLVSCFSPRATPFLLPRILHPNNSRRNACHTNRHSFFCFVSLKDLGTKGNDRFILHFRARGDTTLRLSGMSLSNKVSENISKITTMTEQIVR
jgi:hypothetical protein